MDSGEALARTSEAVNAFPDQTWAVCRHYIIAGGHLLAGLGSSWILQLSRMGKAAILAACSYAPSHLGMHPASWPFMDTMCP